jgi:crotonobetainyl-CoA:carnitine CoA-transferase CaiB-like acyl-CoA transferase
VHGALVTLASFFYRMKSGRGQVIDLSQQECLAPMIELNWPFYSYAGKEITRLGGRFNPQPADVFECADGKVLMTVYGDHIWRRFVEFMGSPQWACNEAYKDGFGRFEHGEFIRNKVAEWTLNWKVKDLCRELQKLPVPVEPVYTVADVYDDPHLRERRAFVPMPIGEGRHVPVPASPLRLAAMPAEGNRASRSRTAPGRRLGAWGLELRLSLLLLLVLMAGHKRGDRCREFGCCISVGFRPDHTAHCNWPIWVPTSSGWKARGVRACTATLCRWPMIFAI